MVSNIRRHKVGALLDAVVQGVVASVAVGWIGMYPNGGP